MKKLLFNKLRTSALAILLIFAITFVPFPSNFDTNSSCTENITFSIQAATKNQKDCFSLKDVPKYKGVVDGNYLYNRCHLIAFCLTGENSNKKNLITGTRYLNVEGMLPYEGNALPIDGIYGISFWVFCQHAAQYLIFFPSSFSLFFI